MIARYLFNQKTSLSIITVFLILFLINKITGIYFDSYESIINYSVHVSGETGVINLSPSNNDFILLQIYMYLQKFWPEAPIFAIAKLFFTTLSFTVILYCLPRIFNSRNTVVVLTLITLTILSTNFVLISNVRISFSLGFSALLFLFSHRDKLKPSKVFLFYLLAICSILNRIEIAIIIFTLGILSAILFYHKKIAFHIIGAILIASIAYFGFYWVNIKYFESIHKGLKYEKALDDRGDFKFSDLKIDEHANSNDLKYYAIALNILDEPKLDTDNFDYTLLLKNRSFINYLSNFNQFKKVYIDQLSEMTEYLYKNLWPFLFILIILSFLYIKVALRDRAFFKYATLYLSVFSIPFLMAIFGEVTPSFLSPYLSTCLLSLLIFVAPTFEKHKNLYLSGFLLIGLFILNSDLKPSLKDKQLQQSISEKIYNDFKTEDQVFLLSMLDWSILPQKLFHQDANYIFNSISFGLFDHTNFFKEHKLQVFGENYQSLSSRFEFVIQKKTPVYGNEFIVNFYKIYLSKVHNLEIDFTQLKKFEGSNVNKYSVQLHE